jgi:hypothetical protein
MSAYVAQLKQQLSESHTQPPQVSLRQKIIDWHRNLPEVSRNRAFAMQEIEDAVKSQGKYISAVLLELGWQRKRKWSTQGHYFRYWLPPTGNGNVSANGID